MSKFEKQAAKLLSTATVFLFNISVFAAIALHASAIGSYAY